MDRNRHAMECLEHSYATAAESLACDEALLDLCEERGGGEMLAFWEPGETFVVVGYANKVASEVNVPACAADGVSIFRRCTGGGTVLQGPGCLNYSLILRAEMGSPLQTITGANQFIMERHRTALANALGRTVGVQGHTDLTLEGRKFSGNAQRRKHRFLLFHGCFLLTLDFARIERYLRMPSKQPDYRQHRSHTEFLTSLPLSAAVIKAALQDAWGAKEPAPIRPTERIGTLAREKYSSPEWNLKF